MCRAESCYPSSPLCVLPVPPAAMPSHQLIQPARPRLPRKLASSARINLNKYWHVLEDLMPVSIPRRAFDESDSNAINENIDNELKLAAMQLSESLANKSADSSSMSASSTGIVINCGKKPSTSNCLPLPRAASAVDSNLRAMELASSTSSSSLTVSESPLSEDEMSVDENTPPSKSSGEEFSR